MSRYLEAKRRIEEMNLEFDAYLRRDQAGERGLSRPSIERFIEAMRNEYRRLAESTIRLDRNDGNSILDCLRSYELIWKRQEEMHLEESKMAYERSKFLDDAIQKVVKACEKYGFPMPDGIEDSLKDQYDEVARTGMKPFIAFNKSHGFVVKGR